MTARRDRRFDAVDRAIVQLVPLVLDDAWTAVAAATALRKRGHGEAVLRRARARAWRALAERPSPVSERAVATLDLALSLGHPRPEGLLAPSAARTSASRP